MMKILHFILGKANPERANGVNQVIYGLAKYQTLEGNDVVVVGISKSIKEQSEMVDREFFQVNVFRKFGGALQFIKNNINNVDVVHLHGVWNFMNVRLGCYLRSIGKPYVITAHCGYSLDRLKQSNYYLKLLYHYVWQKKLYENAAGIHAITREESTDVLRFCRNQNVFVVPNGLEQNYYAAYSYEVKKRDKIRLGYVGRLSVEKNIGNLIKALLGLPKELKNVVELYLIGPINSEASRLELLVKEWGLEEQVIFAGALYGQDKIKAMLDLDVYVHPAYSDVIGISVIEALSLGLPTIVTRTSHMSYYYGSNAFVMVEPTSNDIGRGICEMIRNRDNWQTYSQKAKQLATSQFNWEKIVKQLDGELKKVLE